METLAFSYNKVFCFVINMYQRYTEGENTLSRALRSGGIDSSAVTLSSLRLAGSGIGLRSPLLFVLLFHASKGATFVYIVDEDDDDDDDDDDDVGGASYSKCG